MTFRMRHPAWWRPPQNRRRRSGAEVVDTGQETLKSVEPSVGCDEVPWQAGSVRSSVATLREGCRRAACDPELRQSGDTRDLLLARVPS